MGEPHESGRGAGGHARTHGPHLNFEFKFESDFESKFESDFESDFASDSESPAVKTPGRQGPKKQKRLKISEGPYVNI